MNTTVNVGSVCLNNPLLLASGTCGFGRELSDYVDLSKIGGICSKGLTPLPRLGNDGCRVAETASGMLNSVGLQNPGVDYFIDNDLSFMASLGCKVIVNAAGHSKADYVQMVSKLASFPEQISAIELNLSCPNVKEGCMIFGSSPKAIFELVSELRRMTVIPLWVKLTPNITSVSEAALAAQEAGADAVVAINTLLGMAIDKKTRRPILTNNTGGLSGPAIKPVALRMVSECFRALKIPVIGCGGIMTASDVIEFMIAGATAVEIGTSTLIHPASCETILKDLLSYMAEERIDKLSDIIGTLKLWGE